MSPQLERAGGARTGEWGRTGERGSIVLLGSGAVLVLLVVGVLSIDLWRAFAHRQELSAVADAAAAAGANGIDQARYRADGHLVLDPDLAVSLAHEVLAHEVLAHQGRTRPGTDGPAIGSSSIDASPEMVVVVLEGEVRLTLLGLFARSGDEAGRGGFRIRATAEAAPHRSR